MCSSNRVKCKFSGHTPVWGRKLTQKPNHSPAARTFILNGVESEATGKSLLGLYGHAASAPCGGRGRETPPRPCHTCCQGN